MSFQVLVSEGFGVKGSTSNEILGLGHEGCEITF